MNLFLLAHTLQQFSVQWSEKFDREGNGNEKDNPYGRNPCQRYVGDITRQSAKAWMNLLGICPNTAAQIVTRKPVYAQR